MRRDLKNWSKKLSNLNEAIDNSNKAIFYIDTLEDLRRLSRPEWNFRIIIKRHLLNLLHYKTLYWRKRCTIDRVQFGDENSKYFHATATISYRKNHISQITAMDGRIITDHGAKAVVFWSAFKDRMGITTMPRMDFNLGELIDINVDLNSLVKIVSKEQIDQVIKSIPTDKAPGPDGFNGLFFKKCWPIIK